MVPGPLNPPTRSAHPPRMAAPWPPTPVGEFSATNALPNGFKTSSPSTSLPRPRCSNSPPAHPPCNSFAAPKPPMVAGVHTRIPRPNPSTPPSRSSLSPDIVTNPAFPPASETGANSSPPTNNPMAPGPPPPVPAAAKAMPNASPPPPGPPSLSSKPANSVLRWGQQPG